MGIAVQAARHMIEFHRLFGLSPILLDISEGTRKPRHPFPLSTVRDLSYSGGQYCSMNYSAIPAVPPPLGVTPNFINPESRTRLTVILCSAILVPMLALVALRIYSKVVIAHSFGLEDCE